MLALLVSCQMKLNNTCALRQIFILCDTIALAVGKAIFAPNASEFIELLAQTQRK